MGRCRAGLVTVVAVVALAACVGQRKVDLRQYVTGHEPDWVPEPVCTQVFGGPKQAWDRLGVTSDAMSAHLASTAQWDVAHVQEGMVACTIVDKKNGVATGDPSATWAIFIASVGRPWACVQGTHSATAEASDHDKRASVTVTLPDIQPQLDTAAAGDLLRRAIGHLA